MSEIAVKLTGVHKGFGKREVLRGIDLSIPAAYIQSQSPSRRFFVRAMFLGYILVFSRGALSITASMIILNAIFSFAAWAKFLQLSLVGIISGLIMIALSLLAGGRVKSSIAWLVVSLLATFILPLSRLCFPDWLLISAIMILTGGLPWLAMRKWAKMEFDFVFH
jgi:hypothetical protein